MALTVGSFFSGVGGLDGPFSAELGYEHAFLCESDPNCRAVLRRHFPGVPIFDDITTFDPEPWRGRLDVVVGGVPCFIAGTLVLTSAGYVPIEIVREGDLVWTHKGRWRSVLAVGNKTTSELVRVEAMGVPPLVTTPEHPFLVRRLTRPWDNERRANYRSWSEPEWVEAGLLQRGDFLAQPMTAGERGTVAVGSGTAYLIGRWLGDGWRTKKGAALICASHEEADELGQRMAEAGIRTSRAVQRTTVRFQTSDKSFRALLDDCGSYAYGKRVPGWVFGLPPDEQAAVLRGWLDADGSVEKVWGGRRATTVSKELAVGMAHLTRQVHGVAASVHWTDVAPTTVIEGRIVNQRPQFTVQFYGRNREAFVEDGWAWVPFRQVDSIPGTERVFNLAVEEDESYTADGVCVHNCQDWSVAGRRAGLAGERSGLFFEFAGIVDAIAPRWVIFENVAGLLSACSCHRCERGNRPGHAGRDFAVVLAELTGWHPDPPADGWRGAGYCRGDKGGAAWRVLDARGFGVPHRRRRVFVVVERAGVGAGAVEVLLDPEGREGRPPTGGEAPAIAAGTSARRTDTFNGGGARR